MIKQIWKSGRNILPNFFTISPLTMQVVFFLSPGVILISWKYTQDDLFEVKQAFPLIFYRTKVQRRIFQYGKFFNKVQIWFLYFPPQCIFFCSFIWWRRNAFFNWYSLFTNVNIGLPGNCLEDAPKEPLASR